MGGNVVSRLQSRASWLRLSLIRNLSIGNSRQHIKTAHDVILENYALLDLDIMTFEKCLAETHR